MISVSQLSHRPHPNMEVAHTCVYETRQSDDRLISITGFSTLVRGHLYFEMGPASLVMTRFGRCIYKWMGLPVASILHTMRFILSKILTSKSPMVIFLASNQSRLTISWVFFFSLFDHVLPLKSWRDRYQHWSECPISQGPFTPNKTL